MFPFFFFFLVHVTLGTHDLQSCSRTIKPVLMVGILTSQDLKVSMTDWGVARPAGMFHCIQKKRKERLATKYTADKESRKRGRPAYIVGIKFLSPDRGLVSQLSGDSTDTSIDIAIRWAPVNGCDANNALNSLLSPLELSNNLLVGQRGHGRVGPGYFIRQDME